MPWDVLYFKAADGSVPAEDFLDACPTNVEAKLQAVLSAVAAAPPPSFSGGGMWEAMHGDMTGYFEVRVGGPGGEHSGSSACWRRAERVFQGRRSSYLAVCARRFRTTLSGGDYAEVRRLGEEFKRSSPPTVAT